MALTGGNLENRTRPYRKKIESIKSREAPGTKAWKDNIHTIIVSCAAIVEVLRLHFEKHDVKADLSFDKASNELEFVRETLRHNIVYLSMPVSGKMWALLRDECEEVISQDIPNLKTQLSIYRELVDSYHAIVSTEAYTKAGAVGRHLKDLNTLAKKLLEVRTFIRELHEKLVTIADGWKIGPSI